MQAATDRQTLIQDAVTFLSQRSPKAYRKADQIIRANGVQSLACIEPGRIYTAKVSGSQPAPYSITLTHDPGVSGVEGAFHGWRGRCTCDIGQDCKHVIAALRTWWIHDFQEPDESLAPKAADADTRGTTSPKPPKRKATSDPLKDSRTLEERLLTALQRPLTSRELNYVRKVEYAFTECRKRKCFNLWHANDLGFRVNGQSWERIEIWPTMPRTTFEFWTHVAFAATYQWGCEIPDFIRPITDFRTTDESLRAWRANRVIDRWRLVLKTADFGPSHREVSEELDLRLRVVDGDILIEAKEPGRNHFKRAKQKLINELWQDRDGARALLTAEGALLCSVVFATNAFYHGNTLNFRDVSVPKILRRIGASHSLRSRLVTMDGAPYIFAPEALKWVLSEPDSTRNDYLLQLTQPNGIPLPHGIVFFPGQRLMALTTDTVFFGPPCPDFLRPSATGLAIPTPVIESPEGLNFLKLLQIDPPPRLFDRIHVFPVKLVVRCEIISSSTAGRTEQCRFCIIAKASDGLMNYWNGHHWFKGDPLDRSGFPVPANFEPPNKLLDGKWVSYDRSGIDRAAHLLAGLDVKWQSWESHAVVRVTKQFPEEFTAWRQSVPLDVEVELVGELQSLAAETVVGSVRLDVQEAGIDWFDLQVVLDVTQTDLTADELKLLLNARGGYVRLKGKGWRRLKFDLSADEDERLARLGLSAHELTGEPQRLHVLQLADAAARKFLPEAQFDRVQRRAAELQARVTPPIPQGVAAQLRPYQCEGFHFLCYLSTNRFGGILADDMGLGKTLQTLTWLKWLRDQTSSEGATSAGKPVLVVCPKSVMDNWRVETERFTPDLRTRVWAASELDGMLEAIGSADIHVLNYSQLRLLSESLRVVNWLAVILDEGQYIKNPDSQTAQVARSLRAEHRLVLSGTPIENRLMDLWSLLTFAMPGALGSRAVFNRQFGNKEDPLARRRLASRVRPFLLRRTKAQVARDLPDKIEEDLYCEMEDEQRALYRAELKRAQRMLLKVQTAKEFAEERFNFLTSLLRLRQICCHPRLVQNDSNAASAKVEALIEQLEPLLDEGHKVLVFSQFVTLMDLLKETFQERQWPFYFLAGETENRGALVEQFQTTQGSAIFLISLKAGGFGLNLTAASYVMLFDPWWNPAVENQAIDRTHRIGQTQKVIAYRLLMKNSIEEKIRQLQKQKRHLAEDVLGEEKFGQALGLDDLRFLLSD